MPKNQSRGSDGRFVKTPAAVAGRRRAGRARKAPELRTIRRRINGRIRVQQLPQG